MSAADGLLIGVGQERRGDDVVGLLVARRLRSDPGVRGVRVLEHAGDGLDLVFAFDGADRVVIVDAVRSGRRPGGGIFRFDAATGSLPAAMRPGTSTHAFGLAGAVEMARTLGRLPSRLVIYGIEGVSFAMGSPPSPAVVAAVDAVAERALRDLGPGRPGDA